MTTFSTAQRQSLAKTGAAMPGGRYPIRNATDLQHAKEAIGRTPPGGRPAVEAHIQERASALGLGAVKKALGKKK
jgi:hypothetical protein